MDFYEEVALADVIIATFTENIKRLKKGRERNELKFGWWIQNLLYILFRKFGTCSFPISDWLKTFFLLYFEKKNWLMRKVELCPTF